MSETKFTKGPWRTGNRFHTVFGPPNGNPSPEVIAILAHFNPANARLIAASPTLYSFALKKAREGDGEAKIMLDSLRLDD